MVHVIALGVLIDHVVTQNSTVPSDRLEVRDIANCMIDHAGITYQISAVVLSHAASTTHELLKIPRTHDALADHPILVCDVIYEYVGNCQF